MKSLILIILTTVVLYSCSSGDQFPGNLLEREQSVLFLNYEMGEEAFQEFKWRLEDQTEQPLTLKRFRTDLKNVNALDKILIRSIEELERMKMAVIVGTTTQKVSNLQKNKSTDNRFGIINYDLSKCSENTLRNDFSLNSDNGKKIQELMLECRKDFCEKLVMTSNYEKSKYAFDDTGISDFKTEKELSDKVSALIKKNKIAMDDAESVKQIYASLSYSNKDWTDLLPEENTSSEIIRLIVNLENTLLEARLNAFGLINSRTTYCGYSFDQVSSFCTGDDIVSAGDTLEIAITMAAYNSYGKPSVKCTNGKIVGTKLDKGVRKIKLIVPEKSEQRVTYRGTVTISNKSGVPKTMSWKKSVWVTE